MKTQIFVLGPPVLTGLKAMSFLSHACLCLPRLSQSHTGLNERHLGPNALSGSLRPLWLPEVRVESARPPLLPLLGRTGWSRPLSPPSSPAAF